MLVTATQSLWAGPLRTAQMQAAGLHLLCGPPSQTLSPEARAALRDIAALLGEDFPDESEDIEHCPDCTVSFYEVLTASMPAYFVKQNIRSIYRKARAPARIYTSLIGPPLGSRAPPLSA